MPLTISFTKLYLPTGLTTPITATLYYKQYYASSWTLIEANVPIQLDGSITASPPPQASVNGDELYVLRAVNDMCGFDYEQTFIVTPHCPAGYTLADDGSFCYQDLITSATPPSAPENTVAVNHNDYSAWGSLIFNPGYAVNGTGPFTQISYGNAFWVNGAGYPSGAGANTSNGPLNRSGLWATTLASNQDVGFSVCITAPADGVYYVGMAADNYSSIYLNGVLVVQMVPATIQAYLVANGYPLVGVDSTFRFWFIYPVSLTEGSNILEVIAHNDVSVASMGAEIYNNTSAEIQAATSYGGLNLIFSTKDFVGMPVQIGSGGIGYVCPTGYALEYCSSPIVCVKRLTTPVIF